MSYLLGMDRWLGTTLDTTFPTLCYGFDDWRLCLKGPWVERFAISFDGHLFDGQRFCGARYLESAHLQDRPAWPPERWEAGDAVLSYALFLSDHVFRVLFFYVCYGIGVTGGARDSQEAKGAISGLNRWAKCNVTQIATFQISISSSLAGIDVGGCC